jgi:alanyl-tRNA synthetase
MTDRLYYDDPLLLSFRARVADHAEWAGAPSVLLDRSAFYPESGGQMADRGLIAGVPVTDVQADGEGRVHHVLAGPLPDVSAEVSCEVDRPRRRVHMSLHTGQHMLSRALVDLASAETVSARLGETTCTLDVDQAAIDERKLSEAEELVNAVIEDDVAVRAYFPEPGELAALPMRRAPKVSDHVRVVQIGDFDITPCGGTHCTRTGQVGLLRIDAVERYKGKLRVVFSAGRRARLSLAAHSDALRALSRELTCGPDDVRQGLDKLRRELTETRESLGRAKGQLSAACAAELIAAARHGGESRIVATLEDASLDFVRAVAARITAHPDLVALLAGRTAQATIVLAARGNACTLDCGAFVKRAAAIAQGRGGGRPERAEGQLPAAIDWASVAAQALEGA